MADCNLYISVVLSRCSNRLGRTWENLASAAGTLSRVHQIVGKERRWQGLKNAHMSTVVPTSHIVGQLGSERRRQGRVFLEGRFGSISRLRGLGRHEYIGAS